MMTSKRDHWKPLEDLLGPQRCVGFMFMGRLSNGRNQYKHGISRQYLYLDDHGRVFVRGENDAFQEIRAREAIARIEAPLRELGETIETPYDEGFIRRKDAHLRMAGFEVLRVKIVPNA